MNQLIRKGVCWLYLLSLLWSSPLAAQQFHDVSVTLVKNGIAHCTTNANSDMYAGDMSKNFLRFVRVPALQDGQLQFTVEGFLTADNVLFQLTNEESPAVTYGLRLNDFNYYIEDPNGQALTGTFAVGDVFRIVRCKNAILYVHNEELISYLTLENNDFRMLGEMFVNGANYADFRLQFESL